MHLLLLTCCNLRNAQTSLSGAASGSWEIGRSVQGSLVAPPLASCAAGLHLSPPSQCRCAATSSVRSARGGRPVGLPVRSGTRLPPRCHAKGHLLTSTPKSGALHPRSPSPWCGPGSHRASDLVCSAALCRRSGSRSPQTSCRVFGIPLSRLGAHRWGVCAQRTFRGLVEWCLEALQLVGPLSCGGAPRSASGHPVVGCSG